MEVLFPFTDTDTTDACKEVRGTVIQWCPLVLKQFTCTLWSRFIQTSEPQTLRHYPSQFNSQVQIVNIV